MTMCESDLNLNHKINFLLKESYKIRLFEELLIEYYSKGKIKGTLHTCIGQETIPLAIYQYLVEDDWIFSNHRGHGHFLARTNDYLGLACEIFGKNNGVSGGIGGSQHLYAKNFISNGIQGGMTPIAVGVAIKNTLKNKKSIAVCHIGDGTLGEGIVYESLNLAGLFDAPILFVIEDNGIAQSTLTKNTISGNIKDRFEAFGWKYYFADSNEWIVLDDESNKAVNSARGCQPTVLHIKTNRLYSHSKGDDNRDPIKIQEIKALDPLNKIINQDLLNEDFKLSVKQELIDIFEIALSQESCKKVFDWRPIFRISTLFREGDLENIKVIDAIRDALRIRLASDSEFQIIGEDIQYKSDGTSAGYGGAFKVTGNLSDLFPGRVSNTPISEAGIVGLGIGFSLGGGGVCVEIMFGDFMTLTLDQILQHASKFTNMYGQDLEVPLFIRTPMGGRRGYGPTHSQSLERLFFGIQNVNLIIPNHRINVRDLYSTALDEKIPTIFFEHKLGYAINCGENLPNNYKVKESIEAYPTAIIYKDNAKPFVTILAYGYNLFLAEQALMQLESIGIVAEVVSPSSISPLNADPIIKSLVKTGRFISVEEGSARFGLGASIVTYAIEQGVFLKNIALLGNEKIIPASYDLEANCLPSVVSIINAAVGFLSEENYE